MSVSCSTSSSYTPPIAVGCVPLDGKASNPRLLRKHVPHETLVDRVLRGSSGEFLVVVLVVLVVSHADKLAAVVGTGQEDDSDSKDLRSRELGNVGRVGLELELVDTNRDGSNEEAVENLVMFGAGSNASASRLS